MWQLVHEGLRQLAGRTLRRETKCLIVIDRLHFGSVHFFKYFFFVASR